MGKGMKAGLSVVGVIFALGVSTNAQAEEYFDCTLYQSLPRGTILTPRVVHLDEAGTWSFRADRVNYPRALIRPSRSGIAVNLNRTEGGSVLAYSFFFDRVTGGLTCEDTGTSTARLQVQDSRGVRATATYRCDCGID